MLVFNSVNLYAPDSFLHIHAIEISLFVWLVSDKSINKCSFTRG